MKQTPFSFVADARRSLPHLVLSSLILMTPVAAVAVDYDPAIASPEAVLGYAMGEHVTDYHGMERYFAQLAEASPRVEYGSYGTDYERRTLRYVVISSEQNIERLDLIREQAASLTDPRSLTSSDADKIIESVPAVIWLNYSTDGNETAGLESALHMGYHLAADTGPETRRLLEESVILITPIMNPSSHERWASWSNSFAAGPAGNPDPLAMEHNPPWGVLTNNNHFLVDLNRESFWASQRESAALRDLYYEWNPVVFVDHHGEYDDFTGPGYEEPLNPLITESQRKWLDRFGRSIGDRFGSRGWAYSPWETGSFYPGFWESFGSLNGAIGFTYETMGGGSRGLRFRRADGSLATLEDASRQHFEASLAVIETSVASRRDLVRDFAEYWRTAPAVAASAPEKVFVVDASESPARAQLLLDVLIKNRVEVLRSRSEFRARRVHDYFGQVMNEVSFPAGSYWIPVDQPRVRLLLTMMRRDFRLPEVTIEEAETFRENSEKAGFWNPVVGSTGYLFYDVTAWSMPLTFDVAAYWSEHGGATDLERVTSLEAEVTAAGLEDAKYGYLFSGDGVAASRLFVDLLQQDVVVNVAYDDLAMEGREFPRGSVLVRVDRNPGLDVRSLLEEAAARHGVEVAAVDKTYSDSGPSMGSDRMAHIARPKIAVLAGDPVSTRSFGDLWFLLESAYQLQFTAIYSEQVDATSLDGYDVLILPNGYYSESSFSSQFVEAVKSWISRGGTLVCLRGASGWATDPDVGLSSARMRDPSWPPASDESVSSRETRAVPGAILRAHPDPHNYLTFGYRDDTAVLVNSNLAFEPTTAIASPMTLAPVETLRLAGFAYEDSLERLGGTPYLLDERVGDGHVILFLDDPNFRLYWRGLSRLFLNAVLLSPSF